MHNRIRSIPTGRGPQSTDFEEVVRDIFKFCFFPGYIDEPFFQPVADHPTQRRDIVLPITDTVDYFHFLSFCHAGDLILIECKNYTDEITQDEVEKTLKYLRRPSLASIGFLVARNGYDQGAFDSAVDAFRIDKRLIIFIDEGQLIDLYETAFFGGRSISALRKICQNQKVKM